MEINEDGLSRDPMFNNEVTEGSSNLFQGDQLGFHPIHLRRNKGLIAPDFLNLVLYELHLRSRPNVQQWVGMIELSLKEATSVLTK